MVNTIILYIWIFFLLFCKLIWIPWHSIFFLNFSFINCFDFIITFSSCYYFPETLFACILFSILISLLIGHKFSIGLIYAEKTILLICCLLNFFLSNLFLGYSQAQFLVLILPISSLIVLWSLVFIISNVVLSLLNNFTVSCFSFEVIFLMTDSSISRF